MSLLWTRGGLLRGETGKSCIIYERCTHSLQMRGADEGSTILYTVSSPAPTAFLSKTTAVRVLQTRVEGEQLGHTYTPTLQNKATTPNPPSALASDATPMAFRGKPVLGSLQPINSVICYCQIDSRRKIECECKRRAEKYECDGRQQRRGNRRREWSQRRVQSLARRAMSSSRDSVERPPT